MDPESSSPNVYSPDSSLVVAGAEVYVALKHTPLSESMSRGDLQETIDLGLLNHVLYYCQIDVSLQCAVMHTSFTTCRCVLATRSAEAAQQLERVDPPSHGQHPAQARASRLPRSSSLTGGLPREWRANCSQSLIVSLQLATLSISLTRMSKSVALALLQIRSADPLFFNYSDLQRFTLSRCCGPGSAAFNFSKQKAFLICFSKREAARRRWR